MKPQILHLCLLTKDTNEKRLLQKAAHAISADLTLDTFTDPRQLLKYSLRGEAINVVLIDAESVDLKGISWVQTIRKDERFEQTAIIIFVSSQHQDFVRNMVNKGADLLFKRPSTFKESFRVLKRILCCNWGNSILSSSW